MSRHRSINSGTADEGIDGSVREGEPLKGTCACSAAVS